MTVRTATLIALCALLVAALPAVALEVPPERPLDDRFPGPALVDGFEHARRPIYAVIYRGPVRHIRPPEVQPVEPMTVATATGVPSGSAVPVNTGRGASVATPASFGGLVGFPATSERVPTSVEPREIMGELDEVRRALGL
ncbi:MAG: hypothetical protein JSV80_03580 [Acidobacteriota bacterium]|nr:MAG: hypothetical protein JSV80_03580 [Acidobacteriota bacterium]